MTARATWTVPLEPLGDPGEALSFYPRRDPEAWRDAWAQLPDGWRAAFLGAGLSPSEVLPGLMPHPFVELRAIPLGTAHREGWGRLPTGPVRLQAITGAEGEAPKRRCLGAAETVLAFEVLRADGAAWEPLELALWSHGEGVDPIEAVSPTLGAWVRLGGEAEAEAFRRRLGVLVGHSPELATYRVPTHRHRSGHLDAPKGYRTAPLKRPSRRGFTQIF